MKELENIQLIAIDGNILLDQKSKARVEKTLEKTPRDCHYLFIHRNSSQKESIDSFLKDNSFNQFTTVKAIEGQNESRSVIQYFSKEIAGKGTEKPTLVEKIDWGKQILLLTSRSSKFISQFHKPKGIVCHNFWKVVWGTECPYDCSYCYLQLTYRITPYIRQYFNLEKLFIEAERLNKIVEHPILLNSGELADSLALEPLTGIASKVIKKIKNLSNLHLLLLTKSGNMQYLPNAAENNKTIVSVSLNTPQNQNKFEFGTATIDERIKSLQLAKKKGYRVRARIDPIIVSESDDLEQYFRLIDLVVGKTNLEGLTLGQPRFFPMLLRIIEKRNPTLKLPFYTMNSHLTPDGRIRRTEKERENVYQQLFDYMRSLELKFQFTALCKESVAVTKKIGAYISRNRCNCMI